MHEPSFNYSRPRFGWRCGTFSPSRRQIRSTRLWLTDHPAIEFTSTCLQRRIADAPAITSPRAAFFDGAFCALGEVLLRWREGRTDHLPHAFARVGRGLRSVSGSRLISACSGI
jgi:hypothetical protein